ncbi:hypothetical protein ACJ5NV_10985 [Loktanella agnita]|uniref:hypothetical protein n=1 Tax=Loktanella agnita TaxID=287097 RepID=UPI003986D6BA
MAILKAAIASNERPISARSLSPNDPISREKVDACKLLVDDGLLLEIDHRNFLKTGHPLPTTDDGRTITQEWLYRVTAAGQDVALHPVRRWVQNVLANIPSIVVAIISAVMIAVILDSLGLS